MTTNMELLAHHVEHWAKERGLDNPDNSTAQALKLFEEAGELAQAHLKKRDDEGKDAVGDILVVLTIYCQQKAGLLLSVSKRPGTRLKTARVRWWTARL